MLGRVARLYYDYNLTHQEIADLLGVSRIKVTRLLAEARRVGIVKVEVHTEEGLFIDEEKALQERYHLDHVWVAPTDVEDGADPVARLAADCITNLITKGMRVGVGLSLALARTAAHADPTAKVNAEFIPLLGTNPGLVLPRTPANIAALLARKFGGSSHDLAVPLLPQTAETAAMLRSEPDVQEVFGMARDSDIALVGVGGLTSGSSILLNGILTDKQATTLKANGAVGDINARFYDKNGAAVESPLTDLLLAIDLEDFKRIPIRIGIAAGKEKVDALRAALTGRLLTGIVTDIETARSLLASWE